MSFSVRALTECTLNHRAQRKSGLGLPPDQCCCPEKPTAAWQRESQTVLTLEVRREGAEWYRVVWFSWNGTPDCGWRTWSGIHPLVRRTNGYMVSGRGSSRMGFKSG